MSETYTTYNIEIPFGKTTGQVYTICPKCSHDRKKKNVKCLGVKLDKKICPDCGKVLWFFKKPESEKEGGHFK